MTNSQMGNAAVLEIIAHRRMMSPHSGAVSTGIDRDRERRRLRNAVNQYCKNKRALRKRVLKALDRSAPIPDQDVEALNQLLPIDDRGLRTSFKSWGKWEAPASTSRRFNSRNRKITGQPAQSRQR